MERKDRLIQEYVHDPYFIKAKLRDPAVCERCRVVFRNGVFDWIDPVPPNAESIICPACRRIEDNFEGGTVSLAGQFLAAHKQEIMNIVRNTEKAAKNRRPMERIMKVTDYEGRIEITTTYEHLARGIGEAVNKSYKGNLDIQYVEGKKYVRVSWKRD